MAPHEHTTFESAREAYETACSAIEKDYAGMIEAKELSDCDVAWSAMEAVLLDCSPSVAKELRRYVL